MTSTLPSPVDLGAPGHFSSWRKGQAEVVLRALSSNKRFIVLNAPTGAGKSILAMVYALIDGGWMAYLTASRGLQDQIGGEFSSMGVQDVRGMQNYPCLWEAEQGRVGHCGDGLCLDPPTVVKPLPDGGKEVLQKWECPHRQSGCLYYDSVTRAAKSPYMVTNYALWMTYAGRKDTTKWGKRGILVLDEAHDIPELLSTFLRIELKEQEIQLPRIPEGDDGWDWMEWRQWAVAAHAAQKDRLEGAQSGRRQIRSLVDRLSKLSQIGEQWVPERTRYGWAFEPLWPGQQAERLIYQWIPKVILVSATIRPKTLQYLGLGPDDYEFIETPSYFPVGSRLVTHIPTVRMTYRTSESDKIMWVKRIDQIIEKRQDRKGIIHTVSYDRARFLYDHSDYADLMLIHETRTTREVVRAFKESAAPRILVSPAVGTGYDFPMDQCRYQIIGKLPFPDARGEIIRARNEDDPEYLHYLTMAELIQMTGRAVRSESDWAETLIVDDSVTWFLNRYRQFAPQWWLSAFRKVQYAPDPPEL